MPKIRAFCVAVAFIVLTLISIPIQFFATRFGLKFHKRYPQIYQRMLCKAFGIRITVIGEPVRDRGVLMVANHTGYWDIVVVGAITPVSFVAKSEVAHWPFFGMMAKLQRSVFVERTRRSQVGEARDVVRKRMRDGDALVLFPEGTSTDGNRTITFKSSLMGAAELEVGTDMQGHVEYVPVQPVSVSYVALYGMPMGRENRPLFAWYGDMELLPHVWECLKAGPFDVVVEFHPPLTAKPGCGRKQIARLAEAAVREGQLRALSGDWGSAPEGGKPPAQAAA
jgi:1-acyl-sn-glycerol-3-phosphate acyltransferase